MAERFRGSARRHGNKPYARLSAPEGSWKHDRSQDAPKFSPGRSSSEADTLVVSNLHYEVMPADLKTIFEAIGTLAREPTIKYDRSGRSLGVAYVQFSNPRDAKLALDRLNGVVAKGKPMNLSFDSGRKGPGFGRLPPTGPKAASLINRIASAPLIDRVAKPRIISEAPNPNTDIGGGGKNAQSTSRGRPGKSSGGGGGRGSKPARISKIPKTAEELDKELEAYLVTPAGNTNVPTTTTTTAVMVTASDGGLAAVVAGAAEDVEMA